MRPNLHYLACVLAAAALAMAADASAKGGGKSSGWGGAPAAARDAQAAGVKPIPGVVRGGRASGSGGGKSGGAVSGYSVFTPPSFAGTASSTGGLQRAPNGSVTHGPVPLGNMGMISAMGGGRAGGNGVGNSQAAGLGVGNSQSSATASMGARNAVLAGRRKSAAAGAATKTSTKDPGALSSGRSCVGGSGTTACK